jgi:hypothetical protein
MFLKSFCRALFVVIKSNIKFNCSIGHLTYGDQNCVSINIETFVELYVWQLKATKNLVASSRK